MGLDEYLTVISRPGYYRNMTKLAETIAEMVQRPLYRVSCRAIGTGAEAVKKTLTSACYRAKHWNCIFVVEDIGQFLEAPNPGDYEKSRPYSALLRELLDINRKSIKLTDATFEVV